jgi:hypothetical protein
MGTGPSRSASGALRRHYLHYCTSKASKEYLLLRRLLPCQASRSELKRSIRQHSCAYLSISAHVAAGVPAEKLAAHLGVALRAEEEHT